MLDQARAGAGQEPDDDRTPIVITAERAPLYLNVSPERVQLLLATLDPWGFDAQGEPVWRLADLRRRLGRAIPTPAPVARKRPWWSRRGR